MIAFKDSWRMQTLVLTLAGTLIAGGALAQDYSSMGITDVVASADRALQRGDYGAAIPALKEVVSRMEDLTDAPSRDTLQACRFELARAQYQVGKVTEGMKVLEAYLEMEPRKQERLALRMLAQGLFDVKEWGRIEELAKRILALPNLNKEDEFNGNLLLGQAQFQQEKWNECVKPLTYAAYRTKDTRISNLCHIMAVRAMVEAENWYELFGRIPRIYRTSAKYDITLNLTLMKAAKAQYEEEAYLNALLLYRMVLPREKLLDYSEKRVTKLEEELNADITVGITPSEQADRQQDIADINESMKALRELPPYEDEVAFRIGQIYAEVKRYWEGYVLFDKLYRDSDNMDISEGSMMQSVLVLYDLNEKDLAEQRIFQYLRERPDGQYARTLLSIALRNNLVAQNFKKMIEMREYVYGMAPTEDPDEKQLQSDLHYMLSFGYFQSKDYENAAREFTVVLDKFPESKNRGDSQYYRGMARMMQANYAKALENFQQYEKDFDSMEHFSTAMFREAVCLFGLERIEEAEKVFTKYIESYPNDPLIAEAYSMRGDIEAAKEATAEDPDTLDRALKDYRKAIDTAVTEIQASYPAFQAAKVYKLEFKWQEIIDLMNYYLDRWEEKADVAQAIFWIGQSKIELGLVDEGVDAYLDAIERFGNDVNIEGVDNIILELIKISSAYLSEEDRDGLLVRLKMRLNSVGEKQNVLALRLRVAMAYMEGEDAARALGVELLSAEQDLKQVSPMSLAMMCDAAISSGNAEAMGKLYQYFLKNYEESDLLWQAYRARAYQLLAQDNLDGVLKTIDEVQGLFGADPYMGWAQLMKADTLFKKKQFNEAEKEYNMIMGVPEWRGPMYAEAMYGMGMCRLALEEYETAHNFFQRTYLLFKSYSDGDWAAKGYLAAAKCLAKLGREEDARNTLKAMLEDDYTKTNLLVDMAREQLKKYGSQ